MEPVTIILLSLLVLYLFKILFFYSGSLRASVKVEIEQTPFVSVIVAARNEQHNIANCLEALSKLNYPAESMEILLINDQSTDATGEIIRAWMDRMPSLRYLETSGIVYGLKGKANAVAQAIEQSKGEIILTTDADCQVQPDWVRNTVSQYTPEVGCVCGFTLVKPGSAFDSMQFLDWAYLMTIASAGVGWHYPLSAVGNNMSFRRQAYEDVGGYKAVGFSVTEDFALFKAISYKSRWKLRYPAEPGTLVWSEPCANFKDVFHQKKRWGRGGLEVPPIGWMIMSVGFVLNLALVILPFAGLSAAMLGIGILCKLLIDILLLQYPLRKIGKIKQLKYFLVFEPYFYVYVTLLPFIVLFTGKVVWKGRKL